MLQGKPVDLLLTLRRFICSLHGPFLEPYPQGVSRERYTKTCANEALRLLAGQSFSEVSVQMHLSPPTLVTILRKHMRDVPWPGEGPLVLTIDEHSFRGRDLKITIGEARHHRLLAILPDDTQKNLRRFLRQIPSSVKPRIEEVCIDMKASYRVAVEEELPHTLLVVDHFHVIKELCRHVDEIRRLLQPLGVRGFRRINRFLLLKNREDLTPRQRQELEAVFLRYHKFSALEQCYRVKESMRDIYRERDLKKAKHRFEVLLLSLSGERLGRLKEIYQMLTRWKPCILNYFRSRTTNAFIEGVHNKIKLTKRLSYGFRNFGNYVRKVLLALLPWLFIPPLLHTNI